MYQTGKHEIPVFLHHDLLVGWIDKHFLRIAQSYHGNSANGHVEIGKIECGIGLFIHR